VATVVSYADDLDYFARALATLVGRDERAHRSDQTPPEIALAARDIAVTRLRVMCGLVTGTDPTPETFLARNITTDPGGALYSALADLPALIGPERPGLVDLLSASPRTGQKEWQELARAALFLEPYSDRLPHLPGPFAWKVVADIGNLAVGLPSLDEDLARHRGVPAVDPGRHGALRLAAAQLESIGRDVHGDLVAVRPAEPAVRPVLTAGDLASGSADLARLIRHRGADISAPEIRATARILVEGLELAGRIYGELVDPARRAGLEDPTTRAVAQINRVLLTPLATLNDGRSGVTVRQVSADLSRQLRTLHGLCDRLDASPDPRVRDVGRARLRGGLDTWVHAVPTLVAALDDAVGAAYRDRRLLSRAAGRATPAGWRWHPLVGDQSGSPPAVVGALRGARQTLYGSCPGPVGAPGWGAPAVAPLDWPRSVAQSLAAHPNQRPGRRRVDEDSQPQRRSRARRSPGDQTRGSVTR
jgi:hypothetical protein